MKIVWSKSASEALDEIHQFIAQDSEFYANKFATELLYKITFLPQFPEIGKKVKEDSSNNFRQILHHKYRILYKTFADRLEIITIIHGSRNFKV